MWEFVQKNNNHKSGINYFLCKQILLNYISHHGQTYKLTLWIIKIQKYILFYYKNSFIIMKPTDYLMTCIDNALQVGLFLTSRKYNEIIPNNNELYVHIIYITNF